MSRALGEAESVAAELPGARRRGLVQRLHWFKRWMYRGGRPHLLARLMNRFSAVQFSAGVLSPRRAMTLEVTGRRSGRTIAFPVVVATTRSALPGLDAR